MSDRSFNFAQGNVRKLLAVPKYLLSLLFSLFVPRSPKRWVFGSGIGVGEGALAVARELRRRDPHTAIAWIVTDESEATLASAEGFTPIRRQSWAGYWATLRAKTVVITHGLGDVNRFGIFGATIIHLGHGAPLKLLHLDSPVTTAVRAPGPFRALLGRMYRYGTASVDLYVAGSIDAAERLRSAYRVDPGRVLVLGDPRDDELARMRAVPQRRAELRQHLEALLGIHAAQQSTLMLYAPTWRDGDPDPAVPTAAELDVIRATLDALDAHLVIRSHPLGIGAYEAVIGDRIHLLDSSMVRDITPMLAACDLLITDYSSIAIDFALTERPILWFAPDLAHYTSTRGLYEPLTVTAAGQVLDSWSAVTTRLRELSSNSSKRRGAEAHTRALAQRFHAYQDGGSAGRVLDEIFEMRRPAHERVDPSSIFFESFYGRQVTCNPLALDREISHRVPGVTRYWSVTSERIAVPDGAVPVLVGGSAWHAARRGARLIIVNDWLRMRFRRRRGQTVLQTWHGTMLKHLALGRPGVGLRTRLAIRRESRRWSLMLSQNPHSSEQFRSSYAFRGEILETGYPRDDRLARATVSGGRIGISVQQARRALGIPADARVLAYTPTWRDGNVHVDTIDVHRLAAALEDDWVIMARGHTRSSGSFRGGNSRVIDASEHPDVNDVILAADLLVTDYSSIMFDAAVARVPMAFYVPDLVEYRDRERGFTFDFESFAPGPLLTTQEELVALLQQPIEHAQNYAAWCEQFVPYDDGSASARVVDALLERGALIAH